MNDKWAVGKNRREQQQARTKAGVGIYRVGAGGNKGGKYEWGQVHTYHLPPSNCLNTNGSSNGGRVSLSLSLSFSLIHNFLFIFRNV